MMRHSPFRSGAFRFALMLAGVFVVGTIALLVIIERAVNGYASELTDDSISAEIAVLTDEARTASRADLVRAIVRREHAVREHQLRYLLVDGRGHHLAGSLPAQVARVGRQELTLPFRENDRDKSAVPTTMTAIGTRLADGALLVVASDTSDLSELRRGLGLFAIGFGLAISVLALLGGYSVGAIFLRRLEEVNRSVERIMEGSLAERVPSIGMSAEFDHLSQNLNRMLARIEALLEGMRQVSTNVAHDLRTPLTRLRQRLEEMKEAPPGTITEERIDGALAQTDQILGMFRALLRISSLEAGVGRQRMVDASLSELANDLFEAFSPVAEDAGHVLESAIAPGISGNVDPEMLAQAITNLLENAIFHTPPGSTITLGLEPRSGGFAISVADNGPGIAEGERENVLRRFYRIDGSRGMAGSGLGLALVSAVAAIHGARLRLSDNAPGLRVEMIFGAAPA